MNVAPIFDIVTTAGDYRNQENPDTPLHAPDDWLVDTVNGGKTDAGVAVNAENALTLSAVYKAVALIAGAVAKLPIHVYKRVGKGKERDADHQAYNLVRWQANRYTSAEVFRETLTGQFLLHGNGYAFIDRDARGRPTELIPFADPNEIEPVIVDADLWYVWDPDGSGTNVRRIHHLDMIHVRGLGSAIQGLSVLEKARQDLGVGMGTRKYQAVFFKNNARPNMVVEVPTTLSDVAYKRLRDGWHKVYQGLDNAHKAAILEQGSKVHELSINARDAQLIETRAWSLRDVANWFQVPPHRLGDDARTSFNSLEQENQTFLDEGVDPRLCRWEGEYRTKLLTEREKADDTHVVEFTRQAMIRADMQARSAYYQNGIRGGYFSVNEVRAWEGLNPREGGDTFLMPADMVPPAGAEDDDAPDDQVDAAGEDQDDNEANLEAARTIARDILGRTVAGLVADCRREGKVGRDELLNYLEDGIYHEHQDRLADRLEPVAGLGLEIDAHDFLTSCARTMTPPATRYDSKAWIDQTAPRLERIADDATRLHQ